MYKPNTRSHTLCRYSRARSVHARGDGSCRRRERGPRFDKAEALPLALSPITRLLCLDEFDALSLLRRAGEDGVYLQPQEHHEPRHVEPEHEDYHRPELAVDLPVVTHFRDVVAESAIRYEQQNGRYKSARRDPLEL